MSVGWVLNYDSAPFCNNSLHLGHARNYVLGDIRARWLKLRGADCSYRTSFDAFGIPNELGARKASVPTDRFVRQHVTAINAQMDLLGLSYDGPKFLTCNPDYYRWTQWLFLRMWEQGLIYSHRSRVPYCEQCASVLSSGQINDGRCWRCDNPIVEHEIEACFVRTSAYESVLRPGVENLTGWSPRGRKLLASAMDTTRSRGTNTSDDWLVSRSCSWGTPIPAVSCRRCGISPACDSELPILLLAHGGSGYAACKHCGSREAVLEGTLDCFFDDAWCFYGAARGWTPGAQNPFEAWRQNPAAEVHFHAGYDTYAYLPLYRFVGRFLFELGVTPRAEPIDVYHGHDVVTQGGRKMSKRYDNSPDLDDLLSTHGGEGIRLSVTANANPSKPMPWSVDRLDHAASFLSVYQTLITIVAEDGVRDCERRDDAYAVPTKLDRFLADYRVGAALDLLHSESKAYVRRFRSGKQGCHKGRALLSYWSLFAPSCGA